MRCTQQCVGAMVKELGKMDSRWSRDRPSLAMHSRLHRMAVGALLRREHTGNSDLRATALLKEQV